MRRLFLDLDGTLARFNVRNAIKRYAEEKGFFARLLAYVGIEEVNKLANNRQLYVISASPNEQADKDKMTWLNKYLPNLPKENIIFCRNGENKAKIIENKLSLKIDSNCLLLDDYTKNLREWEEVGGIGVKRLTTCSDNSRKLWTGLTLKDLRKVGSLLQ